MEPAKKPAKKPMITWGWMLMPGIYRVTMETREGTEYTVEVKADSEPDACSIAGLEHDGEAIRAYFFQEAERG